VRWPDSEFSMWWLYTKFRRRGIGKTVSVEDKDQGIVQLGVFWKWFKDNVISETSTLLSDAVMIMPFGNATPHYRDEPNGWVAWTTSKMEWGVLVAVYQ
jgi:hypothetical protein